MKERTKQKVLSGVIIILSVMMVTCQNVHIQTIAGEDILPGFDEKKYRKIMFHDAYVYIDTFAYNHYSLPYQIDPALERDVYVKRHTKPTNANLFGHKKKTTVWRAFTPNIEPVGEVTVIQYDKGVEIIKDGSHFFYDGIDYDAQKTVGAMESFLYHGQWEPAYVSINPLGEIQYDYAYLCGYDGKGILADSELERMLGAYDERPVFRKEYVYWWTYQMEEYNAMCIEDLIISECVNSN